MPQALKNFSACNQLWHMTSRVCTVTEASLKLHRPFA
jgi:hypothetical protein